MKRLPIIFFLALTLAALVPLLAAGTGQVRGSYINLRSSGNFEANILGKKMRGQKYKILHQENGWLNVKFDDGDEGWLYETLTEKQKPVPEKALDEKAPGSAAVLLPALPPLLGSGVPALPPVASLTAKLAEPTEKTSQKNSPETPTPSMAFSGHKPDRGDNPLVASTSLDTAKNEKIEPAIAKKQPTPNEKEAKKEPAATNVATAPVSSLTPVVAVASEPDKNAGKETGKETATTPPMTPKEKKKKEKELALAKEKEKALEKARAKLEKDKGKSLKTSLDNAEFPSSNVASPSKTLSAVKSPEEYYNLAIDLFEKKKYTEALEANRQALSQAPGNAEVLNNMANCMFKMGRVEEALKQWKESMAVSPKSAKICNNMGIAFYQSDENDKAIEYYKKAILFEPEFPDPYYNLASVYGFKGLFKEALEFYRKYLEFTIDPSMKQLTEERIDYCQKQLAAAGAKKDKEPQKDGKK